MKRFSESSFKSTPWPLREVIGEDGLPPKGAAALLVLDLIVREDFVPLAAAWLEKGMESNSLCELAVQVNPILSDCKLLLEQSLRELGVELMSVEEAVLTVQRLSLQAVSNKSVSSLGSARYISAHLLPLVSNSQKNLLNGEPGCNETGVPYYGSQLGAERLLGIYEAEAMFESGDPWTSDKPLAVPDYGDVDFIEAMFQEAILLLEHMENSNIGNLN